MDVKHIWLVTTIELDMMSITISGASPTITAVLISRMEFGKKEINLIFKQLFKRKTVTMDINCYAGLERNRMERICSSFSSKKVFRTDSNLNSGFSWDLWYWPHFIIEDNVMLANYDNYLWFMILNNFIIHPSYMTIIVLYMEAALQSWSFMLPRTLL